MGEVTAVVIALGLVAAAVSASVAWSVMLEHRNRLLTGELASEKAFAAEWKAKYQQLVEDVRKQANQPRSVPSPVAQSNVIRANSAGEIRRAFERINAKVLADQDQAS